MLGEAPLAAALAVILVTNVVLTWLFGRRLDEGPAAGPGRLDRGSWAVECPACGALNEPDYRFCRDCVDELPTAGRPTGTGERPVRRDLN